MRRKVRNEAPQWRTYPIPQVLVIPMTGGLSIAFEPDLGPARHLPDRIIDIYGARS